ncbi:hypothetical protein G7Y89_g7114 [Cudoniella acicularis]|uniref:Uncharacterized protein n=1 Tax=Cudoniella acicularis TaxID=354080 RepID=A0A8H4RJ61_9HELO|nr:hypothetical protein G7Y89_g7114 [Cudoniella acicularis]
MTHSTWPTTTASPENPIVSPLSLLLCRYPLGGYLSNPNFSLIYSRPNPYDEYVDPLYAVLTCGSNVPIDRPKKKGAQTFWMKTYSENKGLLEVLEEAEILKRTGQTEKQGFVTMVAVETCLVNGQWAQTENELKGGTLKDMA